jgi:hypothetical protein
LGKILVFVAGRLTRQNPRETPSESNSCRLGDSEGGVSASNGSLGLPKVTHASRAITAAWATQISRAVLANPFFARTTAKLSGTYQRSPLGVLANIAGGIFPNFRTEKAA